MISLWMGGHRAAAVAGSFYPASAGALRSEVGALLASVQPGEEGPAPKALIVPHAGYLYSGPVAATVYARLAPRRGRVARVVLVGPSHFAWVEGLAVPSADAFDTPLGSVPVDRQTLGELLELPQVEEADEAHAGEHSLEVQLPFLQTVLGDFGLVPLLVGGAGPEAVAEVLERAWGGAETLVVISSDLSHYLDYETARTVDARTARAIEALDPGRIDRDQACGRVPVQALLLVARRRGLSIRTLDLRNSGDTAGPTGRVVGYGGWVVA